MYYGDICDIVADLIALHETNDPYNIMDEKRIIVLHESLGRKKASLKGFFYTVDDVMTVTINSELSEVMQRIIAAHELGHALLHSKEDISFFQERTYLDEGSVLEKEANMFAAELLISDNDVMERIEEGNTWFTIAADLCVPIELLIFKVRLMKLVKGYDLPDAPVDVKNNFLFGMEVN